MLIQQPETETDANADADAVFPSLCKTPQNADDFILTTNESFRNDDYEGPYASIQPVLPLATASSCTSVDGS